MSVKRTAAITAALMVFTFTGCSSENSERNFFSASQSDTYQSSVSQSESGQSENQSETDISDITLSGTDNGGDGTEGYSSNTDSRNSSAPSK